MDLHFVSIQLAGPASLDCRRSKLKWVARLCRVIPLHPHRSAFAPRCALLQRSLCSVLLLLLWSCGGERGPSWVKLADGFEPATSAGEGRAWEAPFIGGGELLIEADAAGRGWWVETLFQSADWEKVPWRQGAWRCKRPIWGFGLPDAARDPQRLIGPDGDFAFLRYSKRLVAAANIEPGSFCGVIEYVYLFTGSDELPPDCRYRVFVDRGYAEDGVWRVALDRFACDGIPLWSGHGEEVVADIPASSSLRFAFAASATAKVLGQDAGTLSLRVLLNGELLLEEKQPVADLVRSTRYELALPETGMSAGRFRFEIEGSAAVGAVLVPVIGPTEVGSYGERPWGEEAKGAMLFLADTFRADNMTVYGGTEHDLTPNLDRFADEAVVFERAWSPASWTLPAQASMMTGIFPFQHGAYKAKRALERDVVTLAEAFASAGYRTGAITDSLLVSRRFGFDQGFEYFDELFHDDFADTLTAIEEFYAADDGRPTFLFVQTYRTHNPYRVSEETRTATRDSLNIQGDWAGLHQRLQQEMLGWDMQGDVPAAVQASIEELRRLYWGGVMDLDRGFGDMLSMLKELGLEQHSYLLFTSDHGESFGEHRSLFHGNGVWDANVRVPFVLRGPGLTPGRMEAAANLVDIPRTMTALLDLNPVPRWGGRNLLSQADRTDSESGRTFSFECPASGKEGTAMVVDGESKFIGPASEDSLRDGVFTETYDLGPDPLELDNLAPRVRYAEERMLELGRATVRCMTPIYLGQEAQLRPEDVEALEAVGYLAGDEQE